MLDRIEGRAAATETPIGFVPTQSALTLDGLSISRDTMDELLRVDTNDWAKEEVAVGEFFEKFGSHLPEQMRLEHRALAARLARSAAAND
jgi:phosphoenolpyruvate carboxykinase (GTP)